MNIDNCTDHSKWDTCQVEKMGCPGCNYFDKYIKIKNKEQNLKEEEEKDK